MLHCKKKKHLRFKFKFLLRIQKIGAPVAFFLNDVQMMVNLLCFSYHKGTVNIMLRSPPSVMSFYGLCIHYFE